DDNGDPVSAELTIVYDGDDAGNGQFEGPDFGLRSPDNLDWADDGNIYIQEDRSTVDRVPRESVDSDEEFPDAFGGVSREEASIWELDPNTGELTRIAQVDRSAVPDDQIDTDPDDLGDWETSGILDVSTLFGQEPGSLLIADTQAHSLRGGPIGDPEVDSDDPTSDDQNLVQGGQLFFITEAVEGTSGDDILTGLNIAQTIAGDAGNDTIFGGDSDDVLRGDANSRSAGGSEGGDDVIFGGAGDDRIGGKAGNDELHGDEGDDEIFGDDGDDILKGGLGNDILTGDDNSGGEGADTFILAEGDGTDTITDFEVGIDVIGLAEGLTFADLSISGNAISVGDETLATVLGVETLTEGDFTLV
ncbi:MAG: calcium-binding protein, partial [Cyanobacteria bacterium J06592_8]